MSICSTLGNGYFVIHSIDSIARNRRETKRNYLKYNLKKKKGPPHNPSFEIEVSLKGIRQFSATAKTIKDAEINAAKKMVDYILKNKLLQ